MYTNLHVYACVKYVIVYTYLLAVSVGTDVYYLNALCTSVLHTWLCSHATLSYNAL